MSHKNPKIFILSLPHTQITDEYVSCAYTMKAKKLADMLVDLGSINSVLSASNSSNFLVFFYP